MSLWRAVQFYRASTWKVSTGNLHATYYWGASTDWGIFAQISLEPQNFEIVEPMSALVALVPAAFSTTSSAAAQAGWYP